MTLYFLEYLFTLGLIAVVTTQVAIPLITGGRWFPVFRRHDIHKDRLIAEEILERLKEEQILHELRAKIEARRSQAATNPVVDSQQEKTE